MDGFKEQNVADIIEYPWTPDQGDGTYRNPILCADYSDPDVIRHGDDFYLTASSFNCTPGLPILHSRDLVNWKIVNYAIQNVPGDKYREVRHGEGVWAPAIRFHDNKFWIFFPTPDEGIYVTTADDPLGKWSEPRMVQAGKGLIDPCPLWDDDGKAYLVHAYAGSRAGIKNKLRVRPMAPDASQLLGDGQLVFEDAVNHPTLEGPKFLKRNGWYYLSAPAGGVPTGWQLILRSRNIYGPYEPKIVLAQGKTPINGPHQGALVELKNGDWWFVHFQEVLPFGRIVHLQPVRWQNDWPLIGINQNAMDVGEPVLRYKKPDVGKTYPIEVPATSDEFDQETLGLQWQWHANHDDGWLSLKDRPGYLRLFSQRVAKGDLGHTPSLLLQKLPAERFTVETKLEFSPARDSEQVGLIMMGLEHAAICLQRQGKDFAVIYIVNGKAQLLTHISKPQIEFRVHMEGDGKCAFAYKEDQTWTNAPSDFIAKAGRWIGAKVGVFSIDAGETSPSGHADFDYLRFS
jgi:beta-xylosidase